MHDHQQGIPPTPEEWAAVKAPTLVAAGGKSPGWMTDGTRALAAALPDATYRTLPGQDQMVKDQVIAPVLTEFFHRGRLGRNTTMRQINGACSFRLMAWWRHRKSGQDRISTTRSGRPWGH